MDLGIRELPDMSMDAYIRHSQRKNELRAEERGKRFLLKYLRYQFAGKLSREWRGDWPKEARRRLGGYGLPSGASIGR